MNETLKRRLVGLAVLLAVLFLLSLLLPRHGALDGGEDVPVTAVTLSGKPLPQTAAPTDVAPPSTDTTPTADPANPPGGEAVPAPTPKLAQHLEPEPAPTTPARPARPLPPPPKTLPKPTQLSKTLMPATDALSDRPTPATKPTDSKLAETKPAESKPAAAKPTDVARTAAAPPAPAGKPAASAAPPATPPTTVKPDTGKADAAKADATAAAPAVAGKGPRWYVQVGSFADEDRALTVCSLLSNIGFHGDASPVTSQGRSLFRVRVGPYATEGEARAARDRIGGQGYPQAKVAGER